jgi:hypothetical protein
MTSILDDVENDMRMLFDPRNSRINVYVSDELSIPIIDKIESKIRIIYINHLKIAYWM